MTCKKTKTYKKAKGSNMIFIIPLRSKKTSLDWQNVCLRLKSTVDSILNQRVDDLDVKIFICGHEKPEFLDTLIYKKIDFLSAPFDPPSDQSEYMADKLGKKRFASLSINKELLSDSDFKLVMQLDADDILHHEFIANVSLLFNEDNSIDDIMIMNGYAYDYSRKVLAYLDGVNKIFYRNCGSSFISKIKCDDLGDSISSDCYFHNLTNHVRYPEVANSYNRNVKGCYFPGVLYLVNHGSNDASERHGVQKLENFINQYKVEYSEHPLGLSMIKSI